MLSFSVWVGDGTLLRQFFVLVTQDGEAETDTGANQYQLTTAADTDIEQLKTQLRDLVVLNRVKISRRNCDTNKIYKKIWNNWFGTKCVS